MTVPKITGTGIDAYFPPDRDPPAGKYYHSVYSRVLPLSKLAAAEAHNERLPAAHQANTNIEAQRSEQNVFYTDRNGKSCRDTLDERIARGCYTFGDLPDGKCGLTEICIGANAAYFEDHGGYGTARLYADRVADFIRKQFAPEEILSLVFHADEVDPTLSGQYRRPVYHYHLHLLLVPVVRRDRRFHGCPPGTPVISHASRWSFVAERLPDGSVRRDSAGRTVRTGGFRQFRDALTAWLHDGGFPELENRPPLGHLPLALWDYKARLAEARLRDLESRIRDAEHTLQTMCALRADTGRIDVGEKQPGGRYLLQAKDYRNLVTLARTGVAAGPMLRRETEHYRLLLTDYAAQRQTLRRMRDSYRDAVADSLCFCLSSPERKDRFRALSLLPEPGPEVRAPAYQRRRVP